MIFSQRASISRIIDQWCKDRNIPSLPFNIITGLDKLGYFFPIQIDHVPPSEEAKDQLLETALHSINMPADLKENHKNIWQAFNAGVAWSSYPKIPICAKEYHNSLDQAGDRFCRVCGQAL